jgi:dihydroorotase
MKTSLLKGGRVIDPGSSVDTVCDVRVRDGCVAAIGVGLAPHSGDDVIDCAGLLVLPGLIDTHAHVYQHVTGRFGLNADTCGVHSAVTTLVDQGGPSCMTLPGFRSYVAEPAKSRVYAFLSAYLVGGLEGHYYPELYRPECLDVEATVRVANANRDLVKGIKAHAEVGGFARWGADVIRLAAEIGRQTRLPLYIHFGQLWPLPNGGAAIDPDTILADVIDLLKPGDILAHPFSRHPGGFVDKNGHLHPLVKEAIARGLKIDVGHGSHFSFNMARKVLDAGVVPDTLGADMHGYNTTVPAPAGAPESHPDEDHMFKGSERFSLVSAMTTMLALGLTLEEVVPMVTSNATAMLGLTDEIGTLRPGCAADVTVLADERGRWAMRDNENTQVIVERMLSPRFCLRAGEYFCADAAILPAARVA